jgi:ribosomal protein L44E
MGKPANHIPTSLGCDTCHKSKTSFSGTTMSHTGIVTGCISCHSGAAFAGVTPMSKPANHVATSADCYTCHKSTTSFSGAGFNHTGVAAGTCNNCHGVTPGVKAKPTNHLPTTLSCDQCHNSTTSFGNARMNHSGIVSGCANCHNGNYAKGKPGDHPKTTADCSSCHSTRTFDK